MAGKFTVILLLDKLLLSVNCFSDKWLITKAISVRLSTHFSTKCAIELTVKSYQGVYGLAHYPKFRPSIARQKVEEHYETML